MKQFLLVLDGPRGVGKSTVSKLLLPQFADTDRHSLDKGRFETATMPATNTDEASAHAMNWLLDQIRASVEAGRNVIIDSGLTAERLAQLTDLATELRVSLIKYQLMASRDVLLARGSERDASRGKTTDEARFNEIFRLQQAKDFTGFTTIDTTSLSPAQIAAQIAREITID